MPPPSSPVLSSQPPPPPLPRRRLLQQHQPPLEDILDLDQHHHSISLESALLNGSSLQAAQAQAAELRALHTAMVASHPQCNYQYYLKQQPHHQHFRPMNRAGEQWRSIKSPAGDHVFPLSPMSATDSFAAPSTHEYPIFTPTSEELMWGSTSTCEIESTRNSIDVRDTIQAERLNYILDNSKRSMSTLGRSANYSNYKVGAIKGQLVEQANAKKPLFELITEEAARKKLGNLAETGTGQSNGEGCTKRKANAGNDHHVDGGFMCDKCRPTASTSAKTVVPLADSREFSDTRSGRGTPQGAASKDRGGGSGILGGGHGTNPIKAWFSRVKLPKKHGSVPTNTHVEAAARTTFSSSREQSVSSSLHAEVEKDLELAMAMDLMELKVQQANARRDMAIGEVVEMRVAMEGMGRRVAELEGLCRGLRAELRTRKEEEEGEEADEGEAMAEAAENDIDDDDEVGISSRSYGGYRDNITARDVPSRSEFFHAVTEARVEVRQLCRALLQHLQEVDMAAEAEEENKNMKKKQKEKTEEEEEEEEDQEEEVEQEEEEEKEEEKEASGALRSLLARPRTRRSASLALRSHLESLVNLTLFHHFENIAFERGGTYPTPLLHPSSRARTSYRTYLAAARVPPSALLAHNPTFLRFSQRKLASLSHALRLHQSRPATWPPDLLDAFHVATRSVWLVHQLSLSFVPPSHVSILRVARDTMFDARFMEELPSEAGYLNHKHQLTTSHQHLLVKLMVMPGFYVNNHVIKCKVLCRHI